jgi:hypothetical protein
MLVKITTTKGIILTAPSLDSIRFDIKGIEFINFNGQGVRVKKKDLLDIEVSDIQDYETSYKLNGTDMSSCVTNNTNIITIRVKAKWLRHLIVWFFGPQPIKT